MYMAELDKGNLPHKFRWKICPFLRNRSDTGYEMKLNMITLVFRWVICRDIVGSHNRMGLFFMCLSIAHINLGSLESPRRHTHFWCTCEDASRKG